MVDASGGSTTDIVVGDLTYRVHTFTSNGSFVVSSGGEVEYLVVGGGGAGGGGWAGGGGGGGAVIEGSTVVEAETYSIVVGDGGTGISGGSNVSNDITSGKISHALGISAPGGGGGGARNVNGIQGGSGGGAGWRTIIGSFPGGIGVPGNDGGDSVSAGANSRGGGGGGAETPGADVTSTEAGDGGDGAVSTITGSSVRYGAGGGGGAESSSVTAGDGGLGGGGDGQDVSRSNTAGTANTGSGGGGSARSQNAVGGNGGSGIVILRYVIDDDRTPVAPGQPNIDSVVLKDQELEVNFSLGSNGVPETTNIEYSVDNGSNWTALSPASVVSPFTISGLTNGTEYDVKIRAISAGGASTASDVTVATPQASFSAPAGTEAIGGRMYDAAIDYETYRIHVFDKLHGTLNTEFNIGSDIGVNDDIYTAAVQADGKVVIGGKFTTARGTTQNRIARLNVDGTLDTSFNTGGTVGVDNIITCLAIQSDGKIVIGGSFGNVRGTLQNRIARLNTDGTLDTGFNTGGTVGVNGTVESLAIQSDGKIIIGGVFTTARGTTQNRIARLETDGTLDTGFNTGGTVGVDNTIKSISVQSDGKIVIGGAFINVRGTLQNRIARLETDGTLDTGFNTGGTVGVDNTVETLVIQPDGKIVIGGIFINARGTQQNRIARLETDGTLDTAFNTGGTVGVNDDVYDVKLQSDNKILVGGKFSNVRGITQNGISRLNTDGTKDLFFNYKNGGTNNRVFEIQLDSQQKTFIFGAFTQVFGVTQNRVAKLHNDKFSVLSSGNVEYFVVAGGGAGAGGTGGGGGAGGLIQGTTSVSVQDYHIELGGGGIGRSGAVTNNTTETDGQKSEIFGLSATGGGGGGGRDTNGHNGGSGGGGGWWISTVYGLGGSGVAGQGNDGGDTDNFDNGDRAGGGGGASGVGEDGNEVFAGDGGAGTLSSITGIPKYYAAGGGGGIASELNRYVAGVGGSGIGGKGEDSIAADTAGVDNTGSGGGGAGVFVSGTGSDGGSGIIVVRYLVADNTPPTLPGAPTITSVVGANEKLVVSFTAGSEGSTPTTNYEYSTDDGATWTARSPVSTSSPLEITGLTNGVTYIVKLRAVNDGGSGSASAGVSGTPANNLPFPPTITSIDKTDTQLTVNFSPNSVEPLPVTNYEYSVDNGGNWVTPSPEDTTSPLIISGLTADTTYVVRLRAVNDDGVSVGSVPFTVTTLQTECIPVFTIVNGFTQIDDFVLGTGSGDPYGSVYAQYSGTLTADSSDKQNINFDNVNISFTTSEDDFVEEFDSMIESGSAIFDSSTGSLSISFGVFNLSTENVGGRRLDESGNVTVSGKILIDVWDAEIQEFFEQEALATFSFSVTCLQVVDLPEVSLDIRVGISSLISLDKNSYIQGFVGVGISTYEPELTLGLALPEYYEFDPINEPTLVIAPKMPIEEGKIDSEFTSNIVPRRTVLVDKNGEPLPGGFLKNVRHGNITWTRSEPASWTVSIPNNSDDANSFLNTEDFENITDTSIIRRGIEDPFVEAQLWRGNKLLTWGPTTSINSSRDNLEVSGSDAAWYIQRRYVGPSVNVNLIKNPLLEQDASNWYLYTFRGWDIGNIPLFSDANIERVRLPSDTREWAFKFTDRTPLKGAVDGELQLSNAKNWNMIKSGLIYGLSLGIPATELALLNAAENIYLNGQYPSGAGIVYSEDAKAFVVGLGYLIYEAYAQGDNWPGLVQTLRGVQYAVSLVNFSTNPEPDEQMLANRRIEIIQGADWGSLGIPNIVEAEFFVYGISIVIDALYAGNPDRIADDLLESQPAVAQGEQLVLPTFPTAVQFFHFPIIEIPTRLTFSCWLQPEEFISLNDDNTSLFMAIFPRGSRDVRDVLNVDGAQMTENIVVGQKIRQEITLEIPPGRDLLIGAGVRSHKGVSYLWDFTLEWDGGLINVDIDKAVIQRRLVEHFSGDTTTKWLPAKQHPLYPHLGWPTYFKSDINLKHSVKNTGYRLTRIYPFNQSVSIDALTDLAEDDSTSGWRIHNTLDNRYYTTMRDNIVRWDCPMRWLPSGGNLTDIGYQWLGEQAANVVTVQSAYPGSRRQGFAINPDSFANNLTLEEALTAPQDTWDDALPLMARDAAWAKSNAVSLALKLPAYPYFTDKNLRVNEVVPVTIQEGNLRVGGFYRIQSMTLTSDDYLELVCVPAEMKGVNLV